MNLVQIQYLKEYSSLFLFISSIIKLLSLWNKKLKNTYIKLLLRISEITPFYAVMYAPISIIVHDNDLGKVLYILGVQMFWLIILLIISKSLSQYVFNKFDIMGG